MENSNHLFTSHYSTWNYPLKRVGECMFWVQRPIYDEAGEEYCFEIRRGCIYIFEPTDSIFMISFLFELPNGLPLRQLHLIQFCIYEKVQEKKMVWSLKRISCNKSDKNTSLNMENQSVTSSTTKFPMPFQSYSKWSNAFSFILFRIEWNESNQFKFALGLVGNSRSDENDMFQYIGENTVVYSTKSQEF